MASELIATRLTGHRLHDGDILRRGDVFDRDDTPERSDTSNRGDPSDGGDPAGRRDTLDRRGDTLDRDDRLDPRDEGCVVCGMRAPENGACCSSRCAGEAQRQLRRNAAHLRRLERRDVPELRHHLSERNGRLMSAILRWRPNGESSSD